MFCEQYVYSRQLVLVRARVPEVVIVVVVAVVVVACVTSSHLIGCVFCDVIRCSLLCPEAALPAVGIQ